MSFENTSFELPDGTPPELFSAGVEPFVVLEGDLIEVTLIADGGLSVLDRYVATSSDFADMSAATASELSAAMDIAFTSVVATDVGPRLRLRSTYNGARSSLQVTSSGGLQTALAFPTTAAVGVTYPGTAQGWLITSASSYWETGGFTSYDIGTPVETFEIDWGQTESEYDVVFSDTFESGWVSISVGTATSAALFGGVLQYDSFESGWGILTPATPLAYQVAAFGSDAFDSFEEDWNTITVGSTFSAGTFDDGGESAEDFEEVTGATHVVELGENPEDGLYRVLIDGTVYTATAATDTHTAVLADLRTRINANTQMTASSTTTTASSVYFTLRPNEPRPGVVPVVFVESPTGSSLSVVLATDSPYLADLWVGQHANPTL